MNIHITYSVLLLGVISIVCMLYTNIPMLYTYIQMCTFVRMLLIYDNESRIHIHNLFIGYTTHSTHL